MTQQTISDWALIKPYGSLYKKLPKTNQLAEFKMKKVAFLLFTFMFSALATAQPMRFEEGKHYTVIGKVADSKPNVTEYFSFYCPHCYNFESVVGNMKKSLPKDAVFYKSHVDFMRSATPEIQQMLTRAMITGEKMGIKDKVVAEIFKHIHQDRKPFTNEDGVLKIFDAVGADKDKASKIFNSFGVKGEANKMKKIQDQLGRAGVLRSVPMFIVNGKYQLNNRELRSQSDYNDLVNFLLQMK